MPHPDAPAGAQIVQATARRLIADRIELRFRIAGSSDLFLPIAAPPARHDQLWQHTCFEAFVRSAGSAGYLEFNVSAAHAWAAYRFDGYRIGMANADVAAPAIATRRSSEVFDLVACFALPMPGDWAVGLSAVIAASDGTLSYHALRHPPGRPDFHHADCVAINLPALPQS